MVWQLEKARKRTQMVDWCGVFCVGVVWSCTALVGYCVVSLESHNPPFLIPFGFCGAMLLFSHITSMLTPPGYTKLKGGKYRWARILETSEEEIKTKADLALLRRKFKYCKICENFKTDSVHHCSTCRRCVRKMDHHCPWISNCVGQDNLRHFLQFLFYVWISTLLSIGAFVHSIYKFFRGNGVAVGERSDPAFVVQCIISFVVCVLFLIFVSLMFSEQYEALVTGIPGIDALKGEGENLSRSLYQGLKEDAFENREFSLEWLIPKWNENMPLSSNDRRRKHIHRN